jgi:voltage-gated potassium channel Kch
MTALLLGDGGPLAKATGESLRGRLPDETVTLERPSDDEVRSALEASPESVVIATRDDVMALRLALLVEALSPGIHLVVTVFDRTVAGRLSSAVPHCEVLSFAEISAPTLAEPCLDGSAGHTGRSTTGPFDRLVSALWPVQAEARILVAGLIGLFAVIIADILLLLFATDLGLVDSIYGSVRTLTTVQAEPAVSEGPGWLKLASALGMLVTLGFAALFTAGLIQWLLDPRLTGIVGRRVVPRRDHVIVIGMGQVGLRLCTYLRDRGVGVVAVELEPEASAVRFARDRKIPVLIGHGEDRRLLERAFVNRARAVVAATADDLINIEIAITADACRPGVPVVLRAREGLLTKETLELVGLGIVRDIHRESANAIVDVVVATRG